MILNSEQQAAFARGQVETLKAAGTECVQVRKDIYVRLDPHYDSGPWTIEEMNLLADETHEFITRGELNEH